MDTTEKYRRMTPAEKMAERCSDIGRRIDMDCVLLKIRYQPDPAEFQKWADEQQKKYNIMAADPSIKNIARKIAAEILHSTELGIPEELERTRPEAWLDYWRAICIYHWAANNS